MRDAQVVHALKGLDQRTKPDNFVATHPREVTASIMEQLDDSTHQVFE